MKFPGVPDVESCSSKAEDAKQEVDDEEYACILSRMDELEREEEEEAEKADESIEDEPDETNLDRSIHQHALDKQIASLEVIYIVGYCDYRYLTKGRT